MYNGNSSKNQRIKAEFVNREIVACASTMIAELSKNDNYIDELCPILIGDDYISPVRDFILGAEKEELKDIFSYLNLEIETEKSPEENKKKALESLNESDNYCDFCDFFLIDPEMKEALEHWIVSSYLYKQLAIHGEMVAEFMGFYIWGRTTSGQAILLDGVITDICSAMTILDGQKYEWNVD